ncbi:MAG: glycosyltransferase family 2 protein [Phycisphaerales bacterium]
MPTLSAILICKNEAANIEACLQSVSFCDEIVVVDSGSIDGTQHIARRFTEKVFEQSWLGFGPQKNVALDHATGDWVFSIDCDERVTPALRDAVLQAVKQDGSHAAFAVTRCNTFLGRTIRFGDWRNDTPVRLFRRNAGRFSPDPVHERVLVQGTTGALSGVLQHHPFDSLHAMVDTMQRYSDLSAQMPGKRGAPPPLALLRAIFAFIRGYLLKGGFLDGYAGLLIAFGTAEGTFWRHAKRWERARQQRASAR